jgi:PAS domain S-box-containing protein
MTPTSRPGGAVDLGNAGARAWAQYVGGLLLVGLCYFALAKVGLGLASLNPSASPIWPPSGLAFAAVVLMGYRAWPAIFVAAFVVNLTTAGSIATSLAIAAGNTAEALVTAALLYRLSGRAPDFETPTGVARFAVLTLTPGPLIGATIGVGSLALGGLADHSQIASIWLTWWLGDAAGALVITPVIVLWARAPAQALRLEQLGETIMVMLATLFIGMVAFSPMLQQTELRAPLSFLAILPLILAALRRGPRDTATVALILCGFAVWGTLTGGGPFARATLNDSFLLVLAFTISTSVPSLMLSADVAMRKRAEEGLRAAQRDLDQRVRQRTFELGHAIEALQSEVEERREVESQLQEQRMHLLEAQRLADLGSWIWDIARQKVTWSQQIYQIYGVDPSTFGGTFEDYVERVHPEDRERVKATIEEALRSGDKFQMTERIVRPNGEVRHLQSAGEVIRDERGEAIRMLGICQDITERRSTEQALRRSEALHRMVVESVHDYAIYMLDARGHVRTWNAGAARIKRYEPHEIIGRHFSSFYTEEDRANRLPYRALETAATTGKYEAEGWRVRKDGSRFWASVFIEPIRDEKGALVGYAKVTRDITERRQAQVALDEAREKLSQAQKMEALGQLTGGIAHDFNNLLMIVSGHAQILRKGLADQRQLRAIEAITTATNRGESLTRQLLAFSRRQRLLPVVVDLKERVEAVREMVGSSLRGNIELICDLPEGLWPAEVDLSELELALVNIAVNARDAMPDGGTIALSARNATIEAGQTPRDLVGDFVAITMTDTGTGIPREVLPRVFEPFFTTKSVGKGTGLGLSQVYGFAHQSGGTVTIDSEPGRGTTITIYLPRSRKAVAPMTPAHEQRQEPAGEGTILVVEDNPAVADVTMALLTQLGYQVVRAETAAEALARLPDAAPDLVFSDIVMPGTMDGLALAREIRVRHPDVPVLLTSGYSDLPPETKIEFRILRKPFELAALEAAVREAIRRRRESDKRPSAGLSA